jgi:hypothetical protein
MHGAANRRAADLVVTDRDFGQAYLTRGYARRFLLDCLQAHVVLFIGYSFNDRVLAYLARGLPAGVPSLARFAFCEVAEQDRWRSLGIEPLPYDPHADPDEPHAQLRRALEQWSHDTQRSFSDHAVRVREIVGLGPDCDLESQDYLRRRLRDPETVDFFCREATDPAWLEWLENEPAFRELFSPPRTPQEGVEAGLCRWFAERAIDARDQANATLARMGSVLSPALWHEIVARLRTLRQSPELLLYWLPLLMRTAPMGRSEYLGWLLSESRPGVDDDLAVMLFEFLTEPSAAVRPFPSIGDGKYGRELAVRGVPYSLRETLDKVFAPRIGVFARDLMAIATRHIDMAHTLLVASGQANDAFDELSYSRSAIEPHPQDGMHQEWIDIVVNGARLAVDSVADDTALATPYVLLWSASPAPLLRRLAVYAVGRGRWLDSDQKLEWIVAHDWLFSWALHHEVYTLLREFYCEASDHGRLVILDALDAGPPAADYVGYPELRERIVFDLLAWLTVACPDDDQLRQRHEEMQSRHPDFAPKRHPDLDHAVEPIQFPRPPSPFSQEQLLSRSPEDEAFLDALDSVAVDEERWPTGTRREALRSEVTGACVADPTWSLRLADALTQREHWDSDMWDALLEAWGIAQLDEGQWRHALDVIRNHGAKWRIARPASDLLLSSVRKQPSRLPIGALPAAKEVADDYLQDARAEQLATLEAAADWLQLAINSAPGRLAEFFLHALSLGHLETSPPEIPPDFKARFLEMARGMTLPDGLTRPMLGRALPYCFGLDPTWTAEVLIPLFDWSHSPNTALQMWSGLLASGSLPTQLVDVLVGPCETVFSHLDELGDLRQPFAQLLCLMAALAAQSPVEGG